MTDPRSALRRYLLLGAALAVLVVGVVAVVAGRRGDQGRGGAGGVDRELADAAYQRLLPGLCAASEQIASRNVSGARVVFMDQAHQALHILAAEVTAVDRAAAATLLAAKAAVEGDFDQASLPRLARDLPPLFDAARAALQQLGRRVPDPCA